MLLCFGERSDLAVVSRSRNQDGAKGRKKSFYGSEAVKSKKDFIFFSARSSALFIIFSGRGRLCAPQPCYARDGLD